MIWFWSVAFAGADVVPGPSCNQGWPTPGQTLSVAWVSKEKKRAHKNTTLMVVPTRDLRSVVADGDEVALLRLLGLRKKSKPPKKPYKVVMFDVYSTSLCRPVIGEEAGSDLQGVVACSASWSSPKGGFEGCGWTTDTRTGDLGLPVYMGRWQELSSQGYTVWSVQRFLTAPAN